MMQKDSERSRPGERTFARTLGFRHALAVGLGAMIGAGVFVLSPEAAEEAGPGASLSFLIAGAVVLPIAMAISELVTAMPKAGGSYHLISRVLGAPAGALVGPANWLGLIFAMGFYLIGFGIFLQHVVPVPLWVPVLSVGSLLTLVNVRGARLTGATQGVVVLALLVVLLVFIVGGTRALDPQQHDPFLPRGFGATIGVLGTIIISFAGFEKVSTIAEEVRDPGKNLPRAILGAVMIAALLYAAVVFVFTGIVDTRALEVHELALVQAAGHAMGPAGEALLISGALIATLSAFNASLMSASRVNFAMARDRILPPWFSKIHNRFRTPHRSVLVTGGLATALALTGQAPVLAQVGGFLFLVSYALLCISVIVVRALRPEWYRPAFHMPLVPWLPLAGCAMSVLVIFTMAAFAQVAGLLLMALSAAWYLYWGHARTRVQGALQEMEGRAPPLRRLKTLVGLQAEETAEREIIVAIRDARQANSLLCLAADLARYGPRADVLAVRIVTVPETLALEQAEEELSEQEADPERLLRQTLESVDTGDITVRFQYQVARKHASAVIDLALRRNADLLLVGWQGPEFMRALHDRIDEAVRRQAHCDVLVLQGDYHQRPERALAACTGDEHGHLALEQALTLAERVTAVYELGAAREDVVKRQVDELGRDRVELHPVQPGALADGLLREAERGCDLITLGSPVGRSRAETEGHPVVTSLAERVACPLLFVQKAPQHSRRGGKA